MTHDAGLEQVNSAAVWECAPCAQNIDVCGVGGRAAVRTGGARSGCYRGQVRLVSPLLCRSTSRVRTEVGGTSPTAFRLERFCGETPPQQCGKAPRPTSEMLRSGVGLGSGVLFAW